MIGHAERRQTVRGRRTPWHLVSAEGALVAVVERSHPPQRGERIVIAEQGWRVCDTLGEVARVVPLTRRRHSELRVSASNETAARALVDALGDEATSRLTPSGWVVTLPVDVASRVRALARLVEAARTVLRARSGDEFFLLDCARPVRLPPRW